MEQYLNTRVGIPTSLVLSASITMLFLDNGMIQGTNAVKNTLSSFHLFGFSSSWETARVWFV